MSGTLSPVAGFNWGKVAWDKDAQGTHSHISFCSYCFQTIPDDVVPLMVFRQHDNAVAEFCEDCQIKWWGVRF